MTPPTVAFFVPGIPIPKGSFRAFAIPGKGGGRPRAVVTNDNAKTRPWEHAVRHEALTARLKAGLGSPVVGPVCVRLEFVLPRLKGHRNAKGVLRSSAPARHTTKPDTDKLLRAVLDGMTGVIFVDDGQVDEETTRKRYERGGDLETPGVYVEVWT